MLYLSSGRASLWIILKSLSRLRPERHKVILPAYTCPAVASAVLKAGLKPILCDINLDNFGFSKEDLERKINKDTLAVVVVHLLGYPANVNETKECCREYKTFVVEDAAQAFGNSPIQAPEKKLGLLGDAGFYSFGRGKPLSLLHGGVAIFNEPEIFQVAEQIYKGLARFDGMRQLIYGLSLLGYSFFSSPYLYRIPERIPFLHLGETRFEPNFSLFKGSRLAASLIQPLLITLEKEKESRSQNSEWYFNQIGSYLPNCNGPREVFPYLRYPLLLQDKETRDRVLKRMELEGCGVALFYPSTLNRLPGLKERLNDSEDYTLGRMLAERLLTLPVHSRVKESDRERIGSILKEVRTK